MIVKIASVFCDEMGPKCHGWIAQVEGAEHARRVAKRHGWLRRDGRDICPGCVSGKPVPRSTPQ